MKKDVTQKQTIIKFENGHLYTASDSCVTEMPLTIKVNDIEFATIICSPNHLEELTLGFLASEGIFLKRNDLQSIHIDESKGFAHVKLTQSVGQQFEHPTKRVLASCCGKSRAFYFQNDAAIAKTSMTNIQLQPKQVINLMTQLQDASIIFKQTSGLHNAAISDGKDFFEHRHDIGRHNALDKLYGYCIQRHISVRDKVLIFSGRISSEILIKASKIGVGIILSKSAPTSLAIQLARDLNITAIGFIRENHFNIYSHPERIIN